MKRHTFLLALAGLSFLASCSKENNEPQQPAPATQVKTITIDASKNERYLYFSFEKGEVIATKAWDDTELPNRTDWDLAFHKYEFRTNSGLSGKGQGGAYETTATDIKAPVAIPAAQDFGTDTDKQLQLVGANHATRQFNYQELPINHVLSATIKFTPGAGAPSQEVIKTGALTFYFVRAHGENSGSAFELSGKVYIIRTGTGKFAKIKITDYKKAAVNPTSGQPGTENGHITFEYVYPIQ